MQDPVKSRKPTSAQRRANRGYYALSHNDVRSLVQAGLRVYDKRKGGVHVIPQRQGAH